MCASPIVHAWYYFDCHKNITFRSMTVTFTSWVPLVNQPIHMTITWPSTTQCRAPVPTIEDIGIQLFITDAKCWLQVKLEGMFKVRCSDPQQICILKTHRHLVLGLCVCVCVCGDTSLIQSRRCTITTQAVHKWMWTTRWSTS